MKTFMVVMVSAMCLLSACSSTNPSNGSQSSQLQTQSKTSQSNVSVFRITCSDITDILKKNFDNRDLPNAFSNEPTVEEKSDDVLGDFVTYSYKISEGAECILYATKEDDRLFQIFIYADSSKMNPTSMKTLGGYEAIIIAVFEPDPSELEKVDMELDIPNSKLSDDTVKSVTGSIANFFYATQEGVTMLSITPA